MGIDMARLGLAKREAAPESRSFVEQRLQRRRGEGKGRRAGFSCLRSALPAPLAVPTCTHTQAFIPLAAEGGGGHGGGWEEGAEMQPIHVPAM